MSREMPGATGRNFWIKSRYRNEVPCRDSLEANRNRRISMVKVNTYRV